MKILFQSLLQIVIIFFISFSAAATEKNQVASVVVEHWPPWEIAHDSEKEKITDGLAVEILKQLFNRLGIKTEFRNAPWKRALLMIERGQADVIPMILRNSEREAYMLFTIPVYEDRQLFCYSADRFEKFEWEQWEDLKPFRIGLTRGYDYGEFGEAVERYNLHTFVAATDRQNIILLLKERIDITPLFYVNAVAVFKEIQEHQKLRFADKEIDTKIFRFGISKKSFLAAKLEEINKTIREMQNDGTFRKILGELYVE